MFKGTDGYQGSSPRMRGAPGDRMPVLRLLRIIPADAGSTVWDLMNWTVTWDHPRGCGEHSSEISWPSSFGGSSPRMRGAHTTLTSSHLGIRIIPADAGSTPRLPVPAVEIRDHPRGCGEHVEGFGSVLGQVGSSPRMRGARSAINNARQ